MVILVYGYTGSACVPRKYYFGSCDVLIMVRSVLMCIAITVRFINIFILACTTSTLMNGITGNEGLNTHFIFKKIKTNKTTMITW